MAGRSLRGVGLAFFCVFMFGGVAQAAPPLADSTHGYWSCSAHAVTVNVGGASGFTLDPLHANFPSLTKNNVCNDDGTTLPTVASHDALGPNTLSLDGNFAQAQTGLTNSLGPTFSQAPGATGQIGNLDLNLGGGALVITAKVARSYVTGRCVNGANGTAVLESGNPALYPSGRYPDGSQVAGQVLDLRINGMAIPADGQPDAALDQLFTSLSPLAPLIKVTLNKEYRTTAMDDAGQPEQVLTREAVRIELLTAPGSTPLITVVLGSSTVDVAGNPCFSPSVPTGGGGTPPTFNTGSNQPGSNGGGLFGGNSASSSNVTNIINNAANGTNASECAHIRAYFDLERNGRPTSHGPTALASTTGVRHVIRGVVRNCAGKPIVRAKIELVNIIHGKRHLVKTGLRTRAGGKFTMITPNNYTSRTLEFQYRAFLNDPRIAGRAHLRITVRNFAGKLT